MVVQQEAHVWIASPGCIGVRNAFHRDAEKGEKARLLHALPGVGQDVSTSEGQGDSGSEVAGIWGDSSEDDLGRDFCEDLLVVDAQLRL